MTDAASQGREALRALFFPRIVMESPQMRNTGASLNGIVRAIEAHGPEVVTLLYLDMRVISCNRFAGIGGNAGKERITLFTSWDMNNDSWRAANIWAFKRGYTKANYHFLLAAHEIAHVALEGIALTGVEPEQEPDAPMRNAQYRIGLPDALVAKLEAAHLALLVERGAVAGGAHKPDALEHRLNAVSPYYKRGYYDHPNRGEKAVGVEMLCDAYAWYLLKGKEGVPESLHPLMDEVKAYVRAQAVAQLQSPRFQNAKAIREGKISRISVAPEYVAWIDPATSLLKCVRTREPEAVLEKLEAEGRLHGQVHIDIAASHDFALSAAEDKRRLRSLEPDKIVSVYEHWVVYFEHADWRKALGAVRRREEGIQTEEIPPTMDREEYLALMQLIRSGSGKDTGTRGR